MIVFAWGDPLSPAARYQRRFRHFCNVLFEKKAVRFISRCGNLAVKYQWNPFNYFRLLSVSIEFFSLSIRKLFHCDVYGCIVEFPFDTFFGYSLDLRVIEFDRFFFLRVNLFDFIITDAYWQSIELSKPWDLQRRRQCIKTDVFSLLQSRLIFKHMLNDTRVIFSVCIFAREKKRRNQRNRIILVVAKFNLFLLLLCWLVFKKKSSEVSR